MSAPSAQLQRVYQLGRQRGFSLIELIVVVIIISVLAVLAIPSITERMRDRRTQQAAQEVANLYRTARMRALGRGAAVTVRFTKPPGSIQVLEGVTVVAAGGPNCALLPASGCLTNSWTVGNADNRVVSTFDPSVRGEFSGVQIAFNGPNGGGSVTYLDVCFTPMGRAFARTNAGQALSPLTGVPQAVVSRNDGIGLTRNVLVLPNGTTRLAP